MHTSHEHIHQLWQRYVSRTATADELSELFRLIQAQNDDVLFASAPAMHELRFYDLKVNAAPEELLEKILANKITLAKRSTHRIHFLKTTWFRYAAAILLILGISTYPWFFKPVEKNMVQNKELVPTKKDVLPGGNKAILILSGGRRIILDNASNGQLARDGGADVIKTSDGKITYTPQSILSHEVVFNTMSTPRGGQYQLSLPDGSKVWLNAASSITYPTVFTGDSRSVSVTGEVYFEVKKDKKPFYITARDSKIEVLGTHFNVNAYDDEPSMKTTLLEGKVKVSKAISAQILQPGQQAEVTSTIRVNKSVDISQVMAWKNGSFNFNGLSFQEVMRQISRWYDVDVVYEGRLPSLRLGGSMGRDLTLNQVLEGLAHMNVHYRIEDKRLIILP